MNKVVDNNKILSQNLKKYMRIKNISRKELADVLDVNYTTLTNWINGTASPRDRSLLESLANALDISINQLYDGIDPIDLQIYENINRDRQVVRIPVLGIVPAGMPFEAIEDSYSIDYVDLPSELNKPGHDYFALKLSGDSMEPTYNDKDVVILLKTPVCENGDDCCIRINGNDATFKRVYIKNDGLLIHPLNIENSSGFVSTFYSKEDCIKHSIEILGVCVSHIRKVKNI